MKNNVADLWISRTRHWQSTGEMSQADIADCANWGGGSSVQCYSKDEYDANLTGLLEPCSITCASCTHVVVIFGCGFAALGDGKKHDSLRRGQSMLGPSRQVFRFAERWAAPADAAILRRFTTHGNRASTQSPDQQY